MKIILLLPIIAYLLLILVNLKLLGEYQAVNLFWANTIDLPVLLLNTLFIVSYSVLVFFVYDGLNSFLHYKIRRLEKEIVWLKSDLYNNQKTLIDTIKKDNQNTIEKIKTENSDMIKSFDERNQKSLEAYKKENKESIKKRQQEAEKILKKLNLLDDNFFDKVKKVIKK